jgi:hypothetical protein
MSIKKAEIPRCLRERSVVARRTPVGREEVKRVGAGKGSQTQGSLVGICDPSFGSIDDPAIAGIDRCGGSSPSIRPIARLREHEAT